MTTRELFNNYPRLSLKRVCDETGICYQYALKASKQPIVGKPYDPTDVNYEAIDNIFTKKLVDIDTYNWAEIEASVKVAEPISKAEDFNVTTEFKMRGSDDFFKVLYVTETHIVFMQVGGTQPRVMNWDTFLHQSPRICIVC